MVDLERLMRLRRWVCYGTAVVIDSVSEDDARRKTLEAYIKENWRIKCEEVVRRG